MLVRAAITVPANASQGSRVTTWRVAQLDSCPHAEAMDDLSVAEKAFILAQTRVPTRVVEAVVVGAIFGELRLLGRVALDRDEVLEVLDPSPTANPLFDALLFRLVDEEPRTPYEWVVAAGPDLTRQVASRVREGNLMRLHDRLSELVPAAVAVSANGTRFEDDWGLLGKLLCSAQLDQYLGHQGLFERRLLATAAAEDWATVLPQQARFDSGHGGPEPGVPVVQRTRRPDSGWLRRPALRLVVALVGLGLMALAGWSYLTRGTSPAELRFDGIETKAKVVEVQITRYKDPGKNFTHERRTLVLEYQHGERTYREKLTCKKGCRGEGETTRI
jgi:hypothetical protein